MMPVGAFLCNGPQMTTPPTERQPPARTRARVDSFLVGDTLFTRWVSVREAGRRAGGRAGRSGWVGGVSIYQLIDK